MNWKTRLVSVLLLFLPNLAMASQSLSVLDNVFNSPVQTWRGVEKGKGTLTLGGNTQVYGFNAAEVSSNGHVAVKVKGIVDNGSSKTFCHVGYIDSVSRSYLCESAANQVLDIDVMPEFDVSFDDVSNISITNYSATDRDFSNVQGELVLAPGNYRTISIQTDKSVSLRAGTYKIKNLTLTDAVQLYLPPGTVLEVENLFASPWNGRIGITSDALALTVK